MTISDTSVQPQRTSGVATAEQGLVILDGPDGIAITLTPDAAVGTARSLMVAAGLATEQAREARPTDGAES